MTANDQRASTPADRRGDARPGPARKRLAVLCDFDDTAASQNVAHLLLERFAGGREIRHREDFRAGRTSFREYQERAFNETGVPVAEMEAYVRENARLRPGFAESVVAARRAGVEFTVVSAGLDFYIRALLESQGHGALRVIAVGANRPGRGTEGPISYDYPAGQEACEGDWAVCKCRAVEKAKLAGAATIFVGDGMRSDSCAAAKADTVFARSNLLEHCRATGIVATPFDTDLFPLAKFLDGAAAGNPPPGQA